MTTCFLGSACKAKTVLEIKNFALSLKTSKRILRNLEQDLKTKQASVLVW